MTEMQEEMALIIGFGLLWIGRLLSFLVSLAISSILGSHLGMDYWKTRRRFRHEWESWRKRWRWWSTTVSLFRR